MTRLYSIAVVLIVVIGLVGVSVYRSGSAADAPTDPSTDSSTEESSDGSDAFNDPSSAAGLSSTSEAVATLEAQFEVAGDNKPLGQSAALGLIMYGETDAEYHDYLAGFASDAIYSSAPAPYDSSGLTQEFLDWAELQSNSPENTITLVTQEYPQDVLTLATAGDSRSYDLFVDGLDSLNPPVVVGAARGLGYIGDTNAIPLIEQAGNRPEMADVQSMIAEALLYFGDPAADQIVAGWISDPVLLQEMEDAVAADLAGRASIGSP
jgi:HEAT repeat protein